MTARRSLLLVVTASVVLDYATVGSAFCAERCHFLVAEQESNQRSRLKEALRKCALLKDPPAASPSDSRKCTDFRKSTKKKLAAFASVSVQKSGHFWTLAGDAAQGFLKGTCLFVMSP